MTSSVSSLSYHNLFYIYLFITYLAMLSLHCCAGFSLVVTRRGHSLVLVRGLLIVVASLVVEHGLSGTRASVVVTSGI